MAAATLRTQLLKLSLPLIPTHGFTREALSRSVLSLPTPHTEPLRDTAVSALFGEGEDARRTLINAWLDEGRARMWDSQSGIQELTAKGRSVEMKDVLAQRLRYNRPVLGHLPEAFATLLTSNGIPCVVDPTPALKHAIRIADEACAVVGDTTVGTSWYARRLSLAAVYTAAELHQIASPSTAEGFLDDLLVRSTQLQQSAEDISQFAGYVGKSWVGIIKSRGILL